MKSERTPPNNVLHDKMTACIFSHVLKIIPGFVPHYFQKNTNYSKNVLINTLKAVEQKRTTDVN